MINRAFGLISKLRHFLSRDTLLLVYITLLQPLPMYGISIWGQSSKTQINKIISLQKKVSRLIFRLKSNESAVPLFIQTNILHVTLQYTDALTQLMYDVKNVAPPTNINHLLTIPIKFICIKQDLLHRKICFWNIQLTVLCSSGCSIVESNPSFY